jgi:hypothetical protein
MLVTGSLGEAEQFPALALEAADAINGVAGRAPVVPVEVDVDGPQRFRGSPP